MSFFSNIKLVKSYRDKKEFYQLTADIEDISRNISYYSVNRRVEDALVSLYVDELKAKYIEDLVKDISIENVKEKALEAFKQSIKEQFIRGDL